MRYRSNFTNNCGGGKSPEDGQLSILYFSHMWIREIRTMEFFTLHLIHLRQLTFLSPSITHWIEECGKLSCYIILSFR